MLTRFRFALFLVLAFALSLTVSAQRSDAPNTLTLAELTPKGALFYASTRTDPGFIETLDGLINRLSGEGLGMPMSDFFTDSLESQGIRSWLGGSVAVFMLPLVSDNSSAFEHFGILAEITDQAATVTYLTDVISAEPIPLPNGFTAFHTNDYDVVVTENRLIVGKQALAAVPLSHGSNLTESPRFQRALSALPNGGDYPLLVYVDPRSLITASASDIFEEIEPIDVPAFAEAIGVFALGMRQLDGQTYTLDLGWSKGEGSIFDALYLPDPHMPVPPAINHDFLAVIPADAQLVLHGAGLWSQFEASNRAVGLMTNALRTRLMQAGLWEISISNPFTFVNAQWATAFTELTARGSLNMSSEQLRAALDGDSAFALRVTHQSTGRSPKFHIEPGVWFASRDNGAADLIAGGIGLLESFGLTLNLQAEGIGFELTNTITGENDSSPWSIPAEFVWLATDNLTYIGADSLTLENKQTLVAVPRITDRIEPIRPHLLEGATLFAWVDLTALAPILDETGATLRTELPFDSLFASLRQTEQGFTARVAFRLK